MHRWFTNTDRIAAVQFAILVVVVIVVSIGLTWLTTRHTGMGWFSTGGKP